MAKLIYSVPKPLAGQYLEPETDVRLRPCGPSFRVRFLGAEKPSPRAALFGRFQAWVGGCLKIRILGGGEAELWNGSDMNVQTESSTTLGGGGAGGGGRGASQSP